MVTIHSSVGKSESKKPNLRSYTVDDGTSPIDQIQTQPQQKRLDPNVVADWRRQAVENQSNIEERSLREAQHRIEIITGIGRKTKNIPVETEDGNIVFTLRSLKSFEQNFVNQVIEASQRITLANNLQSITPTSLNDVKIEALSHSLFLIDAQPIDIVLSTVGKSYEEQVEARKNLIKLMDGALVDHLFSKYNDLARETYDGYAPKSTEEVKEVVDATRKSGQDL